jgi:hypothetical protein
MRYNPFYYFEKALEYRVNQSQLELKVLEWVVKKKGEEIITWGSWFDTYRPIAKKTIPSTQYKKIVCR